MERPHGRFARDCRTIRCSDHRSHQACARPGLLSILIQTARGAPLCFSDKLGLMRWRIGHIWAIAGSIALFIGLAFASHPGFAPGSATGMSAPCAPTTSIDSAPVAKLLQSHFDLYWATFKPSRLHPLPVFRTGELARPNALSGSGFYGPLYLRPPPS